MAHLPPIPPHLTPEEVDALLATAEREQIERHARERAALKRRLRQRWAGLVAFWLAVSTCCMFGGWLAVRYG